MKLRSYQKKAQDDVLTAWAQPQCKNVLLVSATGSGKTVTAMDLARRLGPGARGVVQAHRAELVGQLSVALGRAGVPHALNCSTSTRRTIVEQHFHELGRSMFDPCAAWAVESVDTALRRSARADVNHVFTDECFPAGTMIDGVPIEQIRPGDTVRAFDEKTGTIVLSKVVRTMRNPAPAEMVRVRVAGWELVCTQGHPFFTQRGWVHAAHLLETDRLALSKRGNFFTWVQVASVTTEGATCGEVFNFEVENQHTYIANGVIVHNCHHVLAENKWGRAATVYENARFLGVTATPTRADGVGLGIHEGGLFQKLVHGPGSASLMTEGFLCEYAIKLAISQDFSNVPIGANGEYLASAVGEKMRGGAGAKIVADAVATWLQHCEGKRTIVFATDIEHARDLDKKYRAAQVTSEVLTGEDTEERRVEVLRKFRAGQVLVLINVDLFGEGFDVPSCEVVQMCRPTASFSLFAQMVGRVLRLDIAPELHATWDEMPVSVRRAHIAASRKPRGLVIDHVGNFTTSYRVGELTHVGPPELFSQWTLDGRVKKRKPGDAIPTRLCVKCGLPYEAYLDNCPSCGAASPAPVSRSNPEHVAGCIVDYDPELLASLRAQIAHIDREPVLPVGLSGHAAHAAIARQQERRAAHHEMRNAIAWWAGLRAGRSDKENYRLFYYRFGLDVAQALALSAPDARKLIERIANDPL